MGAIDLLRAALQHAPVLDVSLPAILPPEELRFTLQVENAHDENHHRAALVHLLASDRFVLQDLFAAPPSRFIALRFPTLERVFPQGELFAMGYALAKHLGIAGAEPDLGIDAYRDPDALQSELRGESAFVIGMCRADGAPPLDKRWALAITRLDKAHHLSDGSGSLVGHLDTGLTDHVELGAGIFAMDKAADILDGDSDPVDPLSKGMANPGHGTSTASVLASRSTGSIVGAAPGASVVPIRCIDDVKVFNTAPVAKAIFYAAEAGCHVISMSLGGVAGATLHAAVKYAVNDKHVIVVAAAGNCVGIVVWPARYPEVIAVGGTNILDAAWKGSSKGRRVTVSAPAEFVWRAERTRPDAAKDLVSAGQGTSYATALVAGAAACWLSAHGRAKVISQAQERGTTVCALFASALRATARRPESWDTRLGAGVLDAYTLLQLPLDAIPTGAAEAAQSTEGALSAFLDEEMGLGGNDPGFDAGRYESEISAIALGQARYDQTLGSLSESAKSIETKPSEQLRAAAQESPDPRLRRFGQTPRSSVSMPTAPPQIPEDFSRVRLAMPSGPVVEGASNAVALEATRDYLNAGGGKMIMERARRILAETNAAPEQAEEIAQSISTLLDEVQANAKRSPRGTLGLEALVAIAGRPALRVIQGDVDETSSRAEDWGGMIFTMKSGSPFKRRLDAVGRIDFNGEHQGTGFVVGDGLILTNRHVLQQIASPTPSKNNPTAWVLHSGACSIDFSEEPSWGIQTCRFAITDVLCAGNDFINVHEIDLRKVDVAVLRIASKSMSGDNDAPLPLDVSKSVALMNPTEKIAVIGYPAQPNLVRIGQTNKVDFEVMERLNAIFGPEYGKKYFSPGRVMESALGAVVPDITRLHDATTLGGSSGSLVASAAQPMKAGALHFGGGYRSANYAHSLAQLRAAGFFGTLAINWVP